MVITILFPEFILSKAICELKDAVNDLQEMSQHEDELSWTVEFSSGCLRLYQMFHIFEKTTTMHRESTAALDGLGTKEYYEEGWADDGTRLAIPSLTKATSTGLPYKTDGNELQQSSTDNNVEVEGDVHTGAGHPVPLTFNQEDDLVSQAPVQNFDPSLKTRGTAQYSGWIGDINANTTGRTPWTLLHSYFANSGGFDEQFDDEFRGKHFLSIRASFMLQRCRGIKSDYNLFPSSEDIKDKNKADLLVKLLAVSQISWLVISIIV